MENKTYICYAEKNDKTAETVLKGKGLDIYYGLSQLIKNAIDEGIINRAALIAILSFAVDDMSKKENIDSQLILFELVDTVLNA